MPADYKLDLDKRMVFARGWGVLTADDLLDWQKRIRSDPEFEPSFRMLIDFTDVTEAAFDANTIQQLASIQTFLHTTKRAIVAPALEHFGIARMFQILLGEEGELVEVFREVPPARKWLGLMD
ncbi:MAG TPA: hypothetical protein VMS45_09135 [Gemmatimonadaceae bacterium]|nr:hypothetical protein [Gemmatimonadaceae bacterium]